MTEAKYSAQNLLPLHSCHWKKVCLRSKSSGHNFRVGSIQSLKKGLTMKSICTLFTLALKNFSGSALVYSLPRVMGIKFKTSVLDEMNLISFVRQPGWPVFSWASPKQLNNIPRKCWAHSLIRFPPHCPTKSENFLSVNICELDQHSLCIRTTKKPYPR